MRTLSQLFVLFGLAAWLGGGVAAQVHQLMVQHVVCDEHGDVVELADAELSVHADHRGPSATETSQDLGHGHGCDQSTPLSAAPPTLDTAPPERPAAQPVVAVLQSSTAPLAPPLRDAPKTSPPAAS